MLPARRGADGGEPAGDVLPTLQIDAGLLRPEHIGAAGDVGDGQRLPENEFVPIELVVQPG
jgi:hypothetical protein